MKFRYKVLITNLILLSVSLGLVGYLMIHKNFELAKETQISNAVIQNNLVQSSVEYEVLQALNREESVKGALPDIGAQVSSGMRAENVTFFIYYGDKLVYNETEENANLKKVWEAQQEVMMLCPMYMLTAYSVRKQKESSIWVQLPVM